MYTTIEKIKEIFDTTKTDQEIEELIKIVSAYMDSYVGYTIAYSGIPTPTYYMDGTGTDSVFVNNYIVGYGSIKENDSDISDQVINYPLNKPFIDCITKKSGYFTPGYGNVMLSDAKIGRYTASFGTAQHNLPPDIQDACNSLVGGIMKTQSGTVAPTGTVQSEKIGSYQITYAVNADTGTADNQIVSGFQTLNNYKIEAIA
jgi:hypothetical protein